MRRGERKYQSVGKAGKRIEVPPEDPANWRSDVIVDSAEKAGKLLKEMELKTTKLRKFWSEFLAARRIAETAALSETGEEDQIGKALNKLILLDPRLAYDIGRLDPTREKRERIAMKALREAYKLALNRLQESENKEKALQNFFEYFEAIVAYHKYFGGE